MSTINKFIFCITFLFVIMAASSCEKSGNKSNSDNSIRSRCDLTDYQTQARQCLESSSLPNDIYESQAAQTNCQQRGGMFMQNMTCERRDSLGGCIQGSINDVPRTILWHYRSSYIVTRTDVQRMCGDTRLFVNP